MQIHSILQSKKKLHPVPINTQSTADIACKKGSRASATTEQQWKQPVTVLVHSPKPRLTPNKLDSLLSGVPQMLFSEPFPFSEGSDRIPSPHAEF